MRLTSIAAMVLIAAVLLAEAPRTAKAAVDHSLFAGLLAKYVENGVVDYAGFQKEEAVLDRYLKVIEMTDLDRLSADEMFAFYVNAYNAWTIKLILSRYPEIESIRELGFFNTGPWKKDVVRVKDKVLSLDEVEHEILRPTYRDPRIHFVVNCASISCPPLLAEPLTASRLQEQLDTATRRFVNNPDENYLKGDELHVSRIFKWYSEDFDNDIAGYILKWAEGDLKRELEARRGAIDVVYRDYDWSLNGR
jgi:hypothetical protein